MKEKWEIKKFEDCINKVTYTRKIQKIDFLNDGEYPIISQEEGLINGYWDDERDIFKVKRPIVIFGDHTRILKYVDFDFALGADGVKIFEPIDEINSKFFLYFLRWFNVPSLGYSRHYKLLKELEIPIPPLPVQQSIVAELDTLHRLKELQEQQLTEFDNLAQSTFYSLFGDPIDNEKGWEVKKLGEVFPIQSGGTPSTTKREYWDNGKISWIGSNLCQNKILYENDGKYITNLGLEKSSAKLFDNGFVLIALVGATIGKVALLKFPTTTNQNIVGINVPKNQEYTSNFVYYTMMNLYELFMNIGNGKFKMANLQFIRSLPLISPSLSLQIHFSERIEKIEAQKELIKQSIGETEQLIGYTMDKYFG